MEGFQDSRTTYQDTTWPELGVSYHWSNARVVEQRTTERGTCLEMVHRPRWGMACYMNGEIQSCEMDERIYHESLVHPALAYTSSPRRVLILGGGEGATAREVLKCPTVEHVEMVEWDREVVDCFRTSYPQWAKGAWEDPRLVVSYEDVFERVRTGPPAERYDLIVVDLFEPSEEDTMWLLVSQLAAEWLTPQGCLTMYAGMRNPFVDRHPSEEWLEEKRMETYERRGIPLPSLLAQRDVYSYKVFIPSFCGESMFLFLTPTPSTPDWERIRALSSHLTPEIWAAYYTWNRYRERAEGVFQGV